VIRFTWREFVRAHRQGELAVDFLTVETAWPQRLNSILGERAWKAAATQNRQEQQ